MMHLPNESSLIQPTINYNCLTNLDFTKTRKEKLNNLNSQAESVLGKELKVKDR